MVVRNTKLRNRLSCPDLTSYRKPFLVTVASSWGLHLQFPHPVPLLPQEDLLLVVHDPLRDTHAPVVPGCYTSKERQSSPHFEQFRGMSGSLRDARHRARWNPTRSAGRSRLQQPSSRGLCSCLWVVNEMVDRISTTQYMSTTAWLWRRVFIAVSPSVPLKSLQYETGNNNSE